MKWNKILSRVSSIVPLWIRSVHVCVSEPTCVWEKVCAAAGCLVFAARNKREVEQWGWPRSADSHLNPAHCAHACWCLHLHSTVENVNESVNF